jgi:hypothetical protein
MDKDLIFRGGCAGALITFVISTATIFLLFLTNEQGPLGNKISDAIIKSICLAFFPAILGSFAGQEGARSKSVRWAFIKGGLFFGAAMCVYVVTVVFVMASGGLGLHALLVVGNFSCLIICTGSLISGMAAIIVRDYRQFGKTRPIPQFSLQELMIVTTLVAVILSSMMSMVLLRGPQ